AAPLPRRRGADAGRARRAAEPHRADAGAGRTRLDGRRLTVCALELLRDAVDLAAERPRCLRPPVRDPAHQRRGPRAVAPARGRLVRRHASLLRGADALVLDLKIEGATVVDGTGTPGGRSDVGVRDDTLRVAAMGFARREPTAGELVTMQRALADAVEAGAWGMSTGLIYAPGSYATTAEIVELARICARRQRTLYASHIRGEGATLLDAVAEA